ncbi:hypothetical protein NQ176_g3415 [Zarea fungicola]|uniref:Uncharacterized protein n=1 Tax=Zarea fungicola TaxID=93591 RepID=A0ACC1NJC2_9HYPO|nr:hypothetical protein NQ176_g3415 [Lecanicillium fungicola]
MHFITSVLAATLAISGSALAAPAATKVDIPLVSSVSQRISGLRQVLAQIQSVVADQGTAQVSGQFQLGDNISKINRAADDINSAIVAIETSLKQVTGQYSSQETAAAGAILKALGGGD